MTHPTQPGASAEQRLVAQLQRLEQLVTRLSELAGLQDGHITAMRTDQLLADLARRQDVVTELATGQERIMAQIRAMEHARQALDPAVQTRAKELITSIAGHLSYVMELDARAEQALRSRCDEARVEMATADVTRSARSAYAREPSAQTRFADRHG